MRSYVPEFKRLLVAIAACFIIVRRLRCLKPRLAHIQKRILLTSLTVIRRLAHLTTYSMALAVHSLEMQKLTQPTI